MKKILISMIMILSMVFIGCESDSDNYSYIDYIAIERQEVYSDFNEYAKNDILEKIQNHIYFESSYQLCDKEYNIGTLGRELPFTKDFIANNAEHLFNDETRRFNFEIHYTTTPEGAVTFEIEDDVYLLGIAENEENVTLHIKVRVFLYSFPTEYIDIEIGNIKVKIFKFIN